MIPESDWLPLLCVIGAILGLMVAAELWCRWGHPEPEKTRKLVHLGSGFISMSFGFLFKSHWSVAILCVLFIVTMLITRKLGWLRAVHGVSRKSDGAVLFPIATYLTFLLAYQIDNLLLYFISIAVLSTSDTLAALVGVRYGQKKYVVEASAFKSWEGSIIFFLSTFLIIHLSLLLATDIDRLSCVLIGFWVAIFVTVFEAFSLEGTDNLWIPMGTFYLLWKITCKNLDVITIDVICLGGCIALSYLTLWPRRKLEPLVILGLGLLLDASFRLLQWNWGIPMWTALALFNYSGVVRQRHLDHMIQVRTVVYAVASTLFWVLVSNLFPSRYAAIMILPYLLTIASMLCIGWGLVQDQVSKYSPWHSRQFLKSGVRSLWMLLLIFAPQFYFYPALRNPLSIILFCAGTIFADRFYSFLLQVHAKKLTPLLRMRLAFLVTFLVATMVFFMYSLRFPQIWSQG